MKRAPLSICIIVLISFLVNSLGYIPMAEAQGFRLPAPGVRVSLSPDFNPPMLRGIKVHPDNPFQFDFILDQGDSQNPNIKTEATRLIKYFLASLTVPEKDLWVNLSPYEKNRIVPASFGQTEMGRDLLAEDYMLKQITASLIYPEGETGKKFWRRVYQEAQRKYGTTNVPVNTFNKVWIVPEKAVVYENAQAGTAYIVGSKLKVMLEEDYLSLQEHQGLPSAAQEGLHSVGADIIRAIVIPELNNEVNQDKNFAQLRQVYNSLILAAWYKKKIKDSILEQVYADKNKVAGIGYEKFLSSPNASIGDPEYIYQQYLKAFKKGVFNYIKEETDPMTQETIPRKYFSGGVDFAMNGATNLETELQIVHTFKVPSAVHDIDVRANLAMSSTKIDHKMTAQQDKIFKWLISQTGGDDLTAQVLVTKEIAIKLGFNSLKGLTEKLTDPEGVFAMRRIRKSGKISVTNFSKAKTERLLKRPLDNSTGYTSQPVVFKLPVPKRTGILITGDKVVVRVGQNLFQWVYEGASAGGRRGFILRDDLRGSLHLGGSIRAEVYFEKTKYSPLKFSSIIVSPPYVLINKPTMVIRLVLNLFFYKYPDVRHTTAVSGILRDVLLDYGFVPIKRTASKEPVELFLPPENESKFQKALSLYPVADSAMLNSIVSSEQGTVNQVMIMTQVLDQLDIFKRDSKLAGEIVRIREEMNLDLARQVIQENIFSSYKQPLSSAERIKILERVRQENLESLHRALGDNPNIHWTSPSPQTLINNARFFFAASLLLEGHSTDWGTAASGNLTTGHAMMGNADLAMGAFFDKGLIVSHRLNGHGASDWLALKAAEIEELNDQQKKDLLLEAKTRGVILHADVAKRILDSLNPSVKKTSGPYRIYVVMSSPEQNHEGHYALEALLEVKDDGHGRSIRTWERSNYMKLVAHGLYNRPFRFSGVGDQVLLYAVHRELKMPDTRSLGISMGQEAVQTLQKRGLKAGRNASREDWEQFIHERERFLEKFVPPSFMANSNLESKAMLNTVSGAGREGERGQRVEPGSPSANVNLNNSGGSEQKNGSDQSKRGLGSDTLELSDEYLQRQAAEKGNHAMKAYNFVNDLNAWIKKFTFREENSLGGKPRMLSIEFQTSLKEIKEFELKPGAIEVRIMVPWNFGAPQEVALIDKLTQFIDGMTIMGPDRNYTLREFTDQLGEQISTFEVRNKTAKARHVTFEDLFGVGGMQKFLEFAQLDPVEFAENNPISLDNEPGHPDIKKLIVKLKTGEEKIFFVKFKISNPAIPQLAMKYDIGPKFLELSGTGKYKFIEYQVPGTLLQKQNINLQSKEEALKLVASAAYALGKLHGLHIMHGDMSNKKTHTSVEKKGDIWITRFIDYDSSYQNADPKNIDAESKAFKKIMIRYVTQLDNGWYDNSKGPASEDPLLGRDIDNAFMKAYERGFKETSNRAMKSESPAEIRRELFDGQALSDQAKHEIRLLFSKTMLQALGWNFENIDDIPVSKHDDEPFIGIDSRGGYLGIVVKHEKQDFGFYLVEDGKVLLVSTGSLPKFTEPFADHSLDFLKTHRRLFWWMENCLKPFARELGFEKIGIIISKEETSADEISADEMRRLGYSIKGKPEEKYWVKPIKPENHVTTGAKPDRLHIRLWKNIKKVTRSLAADHAMNARGVNRHTGGIDLTANKLPLQIQNAGVGIRFHLDPVMIEQLKNAPGFVPVIIGIKPLVNLRAFLGIVNQVQ